MVLSTEYSEAVNVCYTFQPLWVSDKTSFSSIQLPGKMPEKCNVYKGKTVRGSYQLPLFFFFTCVHGSEF